MRACTRISARSASDCVCILAQLYTCMWLLDCMQALLCTLILTLESALIISRNFFVCFEALCNVCVYERDKSYKYLLKIAVKEHSLLIKVFAQFPTCSYNCLFSMLSFMPFLKQENLVSMKKISINNLCWNLQNTYLPCFPLPLLPTDFACADFVTSLFV